MSNPVLPAVAPVNYCLFRHHSSHPLPPPRPLGPPLRSATPRIASPLLKTTYEILQTQAYKRYVLNLNLLNFEFNGCFSCDLCLDYQNEGYSVIFIVFKGVKSYG